MSKKSAPTTETLSATEAVQRFGELVDMARTRPVTIIKHGRPAFVAVGVAQYEKLMEAFMQVHNIKE